jgi:hypothetical protein
MPNWLTEVLKLLGLTTPFIYAAASYRFFHWLDQKASGPAKEAFSSWLEPKDYDKAAVAAAIVEVFDHVYTHPLLTLRAFRRSATITLVIAAIVLYEVGPPFVAIPGFMWILVCWYIIINVLTDYGALFVIRRLLSSTHITPLTAMVLWPAIGIAVVGILDFLSGLVLAAIDIYIVDPLFGLSLLPEDFVEQVRQLGSHVLAILNLAGLIVHLWLPFFALCLVVLKRLNYILLAVNRVQWFLEGGKDHPWDALGLVAAPLVFFGGAVVQMLVAK